MVDPSCQDLATKAELQELRDQLNAVLGEKEDGGIEILFEAGSTASDIKDTIEFTVWALTKTRAAEALVDIKQNVVDFFTGNRNLASGQSQWLKVKGSGQSIGMLNLDKVTNSAGKVKLASKIGSKAIALGGGSLEFLSSLVQLGGNLALNKATVDILDKRIQAEARGLELQIDVVNEGVLNLYEKNEGDITVIKNYLDFVRQELEVNVTNNFSTQVDLQKLGEETKNIQTELDETTQAIDGLKDKNQQLETELSEVKNDLEDFGDEISEAIEKTKKQLDDATKIIEDLQAQIDSINKRLEELDERIFELEERVTVAEDEIEKLKKKFDDLEQDLRKEVRLNEARSKSNQADLILLTKKVNKQTFDALEMELGPEEEGEEEEVTPSDVEELKKYINDKVTELLNNQFTDNIKPTVELVGDAVEKVKDVVKHEDHGLEKIQDYAEKAWESTQKDKAMNATTLAFCIHNALMLSNNLPDTMDEAKAVNYTGLGLQNEVGETFDTKTNVTANIDALLSTTNAEIILQEISDRICEKNRIYQSSAYVTNLAIELFDSHRSVSELTLQQIGLIGNSLIDSGVVSAIAYEHMIENIKPQSSTMLQLERVRNEDETIEDSVSIAQSIALPVASKNDVYSKLKAQKENWQQNNVTSLEEKATKLALTVEESEVTTEIEDVDFEAG